MLENIDKTITSLVILCLNHDYVGLFFLIALHKVGEKWLLYYDGVH